MVTFASVLHPSHIILYSLLLQTTFTENFGPLPANISPKLKPGQYAPSAGGQRRNKGWGSSLPDYLKNALGSSDPKVAWTYWEDEDDEYWPDDADDSKPTTTTTEPTTTTTTTTEAPTTTMKATKGPVSIHKHFHYFKKAAPWKGAPMPPEEMMQMMEEMMTDMAMKEMMTNPEMMMMMPPSDKKGLSGILVKLSAVDPITILVAGIIPASLILAAALPSVMGKVMAMQNKGDTATPPPMVSTTAMAGDMMTMTMGGRFLDDDVKECSPTRGLLCRLVASSSDSPAFQRAVTMATVAMENSWLDSLGVRDILLSLKEGKCEDQDGCKEQPVPSTTDKATSR